MNSKNEFLLTGGVTMRRLLTILAIGAVFCLFVPLAMAKGPNKPDNGHGGGGGGGGGGSQPTTQKCDMVGDHTDITLDAIDAVVGLDGNYGDVINVDVNLSNQILNDGVTPADMPAPSTYHGVARVFLGNGSGRMDFFFSGVDLLCDASQLLPPPYTGFTPESTCEYHLRLLDGSYYNGTLVFTSSEGSGITSGITLLHKTGYNEGTMLIGYPGPPNHKHPDWGPHPLVGTVTITFK